MLKDVFNRDTRIPTRFVVSGVNRRRVPFQPILSNSHSMAIQDGKDELGLPPKAWHKTQSDSVLNSSKFRRCRVGELERAVYNLRIRGTHRDRVLVWRLAHDKR